MNTSMRLVESGPNYIIYVTVRALPKCLHSSSKQEGLKRWSSPKVRGFDSTADEWMTGQGV